MLNYVQLNFVDSPGSSPTTAVAFGSPNVSGNLIVVAVANYSTVTSITLTGIADTRGNTYTLLEGPIIFNGQGPVYLYYAKNIAAGNNTVTATWSSSCAYTEICVAEYALNGASISVLGGSNTTLSGTSLSVSLGAVPPGALLVGYVRGAGGTLITPSGYTDETPSNYAYYLDNPSAGSGVTTFAITWTGSNYALAVAAAFSAPVSTGTYYIDACGITPGASNANNGTSPSTPWSTLAYADTQLSYNYGSVMVMYPDGIYRSIAPVWHGFLSYYPMVLNLYSPHICYDIYNSYHAYFYDSTYIQNNTAQWAVSGIYMPQGVSQRYVSVPNWTSISGIPSAGGGFVCVTNYGSLETGNAYPVAFSIAANGSPDIIFSPSSGAGGSPGVTYFDFGFNGSTGRLQYNDAVESGQIVWGLLAGASSQTIYKGSTVVASTGSNNTFAYGTGAKNLLIGYGGGQSFNGSILSLMIKGSQLVGADYLNLNTWINGTELTRLPANPIPPNIGSRGLATIPMMGWDAWRVYGELHTDAEMRLQALALISYGFPALGYNYVTTDAGPFLSSTGCTRVAGVLTPGSGWPNMPALVSYIHGLGLKFGTYLGPGPAPCGSELVTQGFESQDATTLVAMNTDYLKYDNCSFFGSVIMHELAYVAMQLAINKAGGSGIMTMVSDPPLISPPSDPSGSSSWVSQAGWDMVWTGQDLGTTTYVDFLSQIDAIAQGGFALPTYPGRIQMVDFLGVGNGILSDAEGRSNFAIFAILASNLVLGFDLTGTVNALPTVNTIATCSNTEIIAIDQDALCITGTRIAQYSVGGTLGQVGGLGLLDVWSKPLLGGNVAVALLNRDSVSHSITVNFAALGISSTTAYAIRDLSAHANLGKFTGSYSQTVASHDVAMLLIESGGPPSLYISVASTAISLVFNMPNSPISLLFQNNLSLTCPNASIALSVPKSNIALNAPLA